MKSLVLLCVVLLSGCQLFKPDVIIKKEPIFISPPKIFLKECVSTKPIDKTSFLDLSQNKKEEYLTGYISDLLVDVDNCNEKITSIRDWDEKMQKIYLREWLWKIKLIYQMLKTF